MLLDFSAIYRDLMHRLLRCKGEMPVYTYSYAFVRVVHLFRLMCRRLASVLETSTAFLPWTS